MNLFDFYRPSKKYPLNKTQELSYLEACENLSKILKVYGLNVRPYVNTKLERLKNHKDPLRVYKTWLDYVAIITEAHQNGDDLFNNKQLIWRALKKMELTPTADLFELISDDLTLEIYTKDHWQIFRNIEFFRFVSISLDELATFHWNRDTKRKTELSMQAISVIIKMQMGLVKTTFDCEKVPVHYVRELIGEQWLIEIKLKFASPLTRKNAKGEKVESFLLCNKSKVLSTTPPHNLKERFTIINNK